MDGMKANRSGIGPWAHVIKVEKDFSELGVNPKDLFVRSIGMGNHTRFWKDAWFGNTPLCHLFPHLFKLECSKSCSILDMVTRGESGLVQLSWNWKKKRLYAHGRRFLGAGGGARPPPPQTFRRVVFRQCVRRGRDRCGRLDFRGDLVCLLFAR
ncbi:hypothetical protein HanIR_Chr10g0489401 [Helianthus annuus]|nr:hypothetical protein HanIR_Chr10g0489401 [Helianthus annuus]